MSKLPKTKTALAGAIGSAAIAAALLYANRKRGNTPTQPGPIPDPKPADDKPETD